MAGVPCVCHSPAHVSFLLGVSSVCTEHWARRVVGPCQAGAIARGSSGSCVPSGAADWPQALTHPILPPPMKPQSQVASGQAGPEQGALPVEWSCLGWREVKLIRPASQRAGDGERSSVRLWWVPRERGWVRAGRSQERLVIETVFWDFREEN